MADFLGSYYDSVDFNGSDVDERIISQRMAILSVEQPVSIMEMDNLESVRNPTRRRDVSALRQNVDQLEISNEGGSLKETFSADNGSEEDLDIPVASMSMFEQQNSMVSVQLLSTRGDAYRARQLYNVNILGIPKAGNERKGQEGMLSPVSHAAQTPQSGMKITRGALGKQNQRSENMFPQEEDALQQVIDEDASPRDRRRNSIFRFLSRRKK